MMQIFGLRMKLWWMLVFLIMLQFLSSIKGQMTNAAKNVEKFCFVYFPPNEGQAEFTSSTASGSSRANRTTQGPPQNLKTSEVTSQSFCVSWTHAPGIVEKYRLVYSPFKGGKRDEVMVNGNETSVVLRNLSSLTEYKISVFAVYTASVSDALKGNETTLKQFRCTVADIVLLVDGSESIKREDFYYMRKFLQDLINEFDVGSEKIRIGLVQYSTMSRTEFHLNAFDAKEGMIRAINNMRQMQEGTYTGGALMYLLDNSFKLKLGSRRKVPKIGILITDGISSDDTLIPAQKLRDAGVELFAVGVRGARDTELKAIVSEPDVTHMYNVAKFSIMSSVLENLTKSVCDGVKQQQEQIRNLVGPVENLMTSEVTAQSFRVSWTHAPGIVESYRVIYFPSEIDQPDEVMVNGAETSVVLRNLSSLTEYKISVFAVYTASVSEALRCNETTLNSSAVSWVVCVWSSSCNSRGYYNSTPSLSSSPPVFCDPKSVLKRQETPQKLVTQRGKKRTFTIVGDAVGWGFVVRGSKPCHIQAVDPSGPAAAAGMKVCQFVVSVNRLNVLNLDHRMVSNLILSGPRKIVIEVMEEVD